MAFVLNGKPLQILGLDDGANQLRLRRRHLESILLHPKAKDRPVAIVSICGDLRKGKSFMLNVLLRYLAWTEAHPEQAVDLIVNPGKQSTTGSQVPDWMGDANEPLTGFGWRPGTVRMTIGVWMWSEPFIVPLRAIQPVESASKFPETVAVLVMDTQGTFDEHSPLEHGAIVVAFTLLHSCTVLYNLQQNLDERQLQSLQAFAECARLANTSGKSNESPDASSGDDERCSPEETLPSRTFELPKPFQRLLLLIRDWSSPADCPYGACGGIQLLRRRSLIDRPTLPDTLQCSSRLLRRKSAAMKANHKHIWDKRVKSAESISRVGQSNDQRVNKTQISTAIRVNALKSNQTEGAQTSDNQTAAVRPKKVAEQNRAVRRYLLDSFESLDAFLMPHPGTQVSASRTHDGRWSEWSKEFREQAQALILHVHTSLNVLHPLGGGLSSNQATAYSALNGSQLLRRCIRITEKLLKHGSQALPLYEALGELSHSESVEMVCNDFENQMRELFGPDRPWMAPLEWRLLYSQLEANAFKQYDHSRRFNAATLGELYRQQLARRLKQISSRFGTLNRYKRRTNSWRYAFILLTALFCVRFAAEVLKAMGLEGTGNKVKLLNIGVVALLSLHFMRYIWDLPLLDYIDQAGHYVFAAAARI